MSVLKCTLISYIVLSNYAITVTQVYLNAVNYDDDDADAYDVGDDDDGDDDGDSDIVVGCWSRDRKVPGSNPAWGTGFF
ncbi:hypothetical protein DPMN_146874 [Dreissena polymorpha]|uniref:Uncharacterized protein n=1 Tax=Dreissena polymorpha TaxID=45954 RepID=A0A9D4F8S3_DREPO|nr:hypothetical protein DPMN_146874 [Dreissena polymorpha]